MEAWGDKKNTGSILKRFDITALNADSTYLDDGELTYSVMHTDRISLIDNESRLKKNYRGSKVNLEELYNDIIKLMKNIKIFSGNSTMTPK